MTEVLAVAVALLVAGGVRLVLTRRMFPAILGLSLLAHAANLVVLAAGGEGPAAPVLGSADSGLETADPLPQALVLTAIVISMAVTVYLVGLLRARARQMGTVAVETPLADDSERDRDAVARELAPGKVDR